MAQFALSCRGSFSVNCGKGEKTCLELYRLLIKIELTQLHPTLPPTPQSWGGGFDVLQNWGDKTGLFVNLMRFSLRSPFRSYSTHLLWRG